MSDNVINLRDDAPYEPPATPANDQPPQTIRIVITPPPVQQRASQAGLWCVAGVLWVVALALWMM